MFIVIIRHFQMAGKRVFIAAIALTKWHFMFSPQVYFCIWSDLPLFFSSSFRSVYGDDYQPPPTTTHAYTKSLTQAQHRPKKYFHKNPGSAWGYKHCKLVLPCFSLRFCLFFHSVLFRFVCRSGKLIVKKRSKTRRHRESGKKKKTKRTHTRIFRCVWRKFFNGCINYINVCVREKEKKLEFLVQVFVEKICRKDELCSVVT